MRLVAALFVVCVLPSCTEQDLCDPDQRYANGLCYALDAEVTADAAPDASFDHFGEVCSEDAACAIPTTYCAKQQGQTVGYCTRTGCVEEPSICPPTWTCLDLSVFEPGLPSICRKP